MLSGILSALSGIRAGLTRLDVTASNQANLTTPGFRDRRVDLSTGSGGVGVVVSSISLDVSQGAFLVTGGPLDVAINGDSFFEVKTPGGESRFTRLGRFGLDSEGFLVTGSGERVQPSIQIPPAATDVVITQAGEVRGTVGGESRVFGPLQSVRFQNPTGLESVENGLFAATPASGPPIRGTFAEAGFGSLEPGSLEASGSDLIENTLDLLLAQRFIQFQTATIQATDTILEEAIHLGRPRRPS